MNKDMCSQPIYKILLWEGNFPCLTGRCDETNTDLEKKLTRTEGDKNTGRIRPGFTLTEKSLTLHSKRQHSI